MPADAFLIFCRTLLLVIVLGFVITSCTGAAVRDRQGSAGAAIRMLVTMVLPATLLAFVGLFYWPLALGASLVWAWLQGRGTAAELRSHLIDVWSATSLVTKTAACVLCIPTAMRAGAALTMPPTDGDSLLYHLPMTATLVQDHTMWFSRALVYPGATELGSALSAAAIGTVNGTVLFGLVQLLAFVLVAYGWARKAGASIDAAVAAGIVAGALPLVVDHEFTAQNDIFTCLAVACGCALWRMSPRWAAMGFGLALAAKLSAFIVVPPIVIVMIAFEGWPFTLVDLAAALAISAPWYMRTWIVTGSPIYTVSSLGWDSTLLAQFDASWPLMLAALRTYGGIASLVGIVAVVAVPMTRSRTSFARAIPWLALAAFISWIVLPNSAESVPGTLDQIRNGWSLRYALLLPLALVVAVPIVLDRVPRVPLVGFVALVAAASAVVRSSNLTASDAPLGFVYALPLLLAGFLAYLAVRYDLVRDRLGTSARAANLVCAIIIGVSVAHGAQTMRMFWSASYVQWSRRLPPTYIGVNNRIRAATKIAVIGMRSFPFVGSDFERRTYDEIVVETPQAWLARLRNNGVGLLVAAGETGSPDEPGFLQPLPAEVALATMPGVCRITSSTYARVYGLTSSECQRPTPHR